MRPATRRNYLSDLRQFAAWCETTWDAGSEQDIPFSAAAITTPLVSRYARQAHLVEGEPA